MFQNYNIHKAQEGTSGFPVRSVSGLSEADVVFRLSVAQGGVWGAHGESGRRKSAGVPADPAWPAARCTLLWLGRFSGLAAADVAAGLECGAAQAAWLAVFPMLGSIAHFALFSKDEAAGGCGVGSVSRQSSRRRSQAFGLQIIAQQIRCGREGPYPAV